MEDIRNITDRVLSSAFSDVLVCCEDNTDVDETDTYIIYSIEYEHNTAYANGKPSRRASVVNIDLITKHRNNKMEYIPKIEQAMLDGGFTMKRGQVDLEMDKNEKKEQYYRTNMQFLLERIMA